jgi:chemotaxis protein histidine kinase CheA
MDAIQTKAFVIFLEELETQRALFARYAQEPLVLDRIEELRILMHRIKGGAGFFELDELQRIAGRGEEAAKNGDTQELASVLHQIVLVIHDVRVTLE